jgi:hypothetical protein
VSELTPEEFTHLLLIAAAPPQRVGEVVARLVGDEITVGPIPVGPGELATATAQGVRGQVHVATLDDADWHQIVTVPIALSVELQLGSGSIRYHGAVQVQTRLRLQLERPCTVTVDIEEVAAHNIRTTVEPVGTAARIVGCVGSVDETVEEQVRGYVNDLMRSPEFEAALHIDVMTLMERAWDADLVVDVPER